MSLSLDEYMETIISDYGLPTVFEWLEDFSYIEYTDAKDHTGDGDCFYGNRYGGDCENCNNVAAYFIVEKNEDG